MSMGSIFQNQQLKDLLPNIKPEDLTAPYDSIAGIIGVENTLKLAEEFEGTTVYFRKITMQNIIREHLYKQIRTEFDGQNYQQLCKKYGFSQAWIRKIVTSGLRKG